MGRTVQDGVRLLALASSILLTGCGAKPVTCLPHASLLNRTAWSISDVSARPSSAVVYLDRSVSMQGFIPAHRVERADRESLFVSFMRGLPDQLDRSTNYATSSYYFFGGAFEHSTAERDAFVKTSIERAAFTYKETDIPAVLTEIGASRRDELAIVVTDLFFNNEELGSGGTGRIARSLRNLIAQGRSVAIVGVATPFSGKIYDIPPDRSIVSYNGVRPFFALVIGPTSTVERLIAGLREQLLIDKSPNAIRSILFAPNPLRLGGRDFVRKTIETGDTIVTSEGQSRRVVTDELGNLIWQGEVHGVSQSPALSVLAPVNELYWTDAVRPSATEVAGSVVVRVFRYAGTFTNDRS